MTAAKATARETTMTEPRRATNQGSVVTAASWLTTRSGAVVRIIAGSILNASGAEKGPGPSLVKATALTVYSWPRERLVSR